MTIKSGAMQIVGGVVVSLSLACGGGGAGGSADLSNAGLSSELSGESSAVLAKVESGVFVDSPVEGLKYKTNSLQGTTDAEGRFYYRKGEDVEFAIGETPLGMASGNGTLTPASLFNADPNGEDRRMVNVLRLLQSIDEDADPDNGIQVPEAFAQMAEKFELNFDVDLDSFDFSENVMSFLQKAPRQLVSGENAKAHFRNTLQRISKPGADDLTRPHDFDDVAEYIAALDGDADGMLSLAEFVQVPSEQVIERWTEHFVKLDTDASGNLQENEWSVRPRSKRVGEDKNTEVFAELDVDASGDIQLTEWLEQRSQKYKACQEKRFASIDTDSDTLITVTEIENMPKRDSASYQQAMLERLDQDGDASISQEEFTLDVPEEHLEKAQAAFASMDADGDGFLVQDELRANPKKDAKERRSQKFASLDSDSSGELSLAEFLQPVPESHLEKASGHFVKMDVDQSGGISEDEFTGRAHHKRSR